MWALELQQLMKRHILGQSDVQQWRNQAHNLSGYWVTLVWRHQSDSQSKKNINQKKLLNLLNLFSVEKSVNRKFQFHSNLMQSFRVDLKTFMGLAMPNQCYHAIIKLILGWFAGRIFGQETPSLNDCTTVLLNTIWCVLRGISKPGPTQAWALLKKIDRFATDTYTGQGLWIRAVCTVMICLSL